MARTWHVCSDGELGRLVDEVVGQLKKLAITGSSRKDRMFLGVDVGRLGFVGKDNLRDMCINHQLPCDDDIVHSVRITWLPAAGASEQSKHCPRLLSTFGALEQCSPILTYLLGYYSLSEAIF